MVCEGKWWVEFWEASVEDGSHVEGNEEGAGCVGGSGWIVWALYVQKVKVLRFSILFLFAQLVCWGEGRIKVLYPFLFHLVFLLSLLLDIKI